MENGVLWRKELSNESGWTRMFMCVSPPLDPGLFALGYRTAESGTGKAGHPMRGCFPESRNSSDGKKIRWQSWRFLCIASMLLELEHACWLELVACGACIVSACTAIPLGREGESSGLKLPPERLHIRSSFWEGHLLFIRGPAPLWFRKKEKWGWETAMKYWGRIKLTEGRDWTSCASVGASGIACGLLPCRKIWKAGTQASLLSSCSSSKGILLLPSSDPGWPWLSRMLGWAICTCTPPAPWRRSHTWWNSLRFSKFFLWLCRLDLSYGQGHLPLCFGFS